MQDKSLRIIFVADICGKFGRRFLGRALPLIRIKYSPHLVIANGENSAGGLGINRKTAYEILDTGVDVITGGNHSWDKKEALELIKEEPRILRPMNFPESAPGKGHYVFDINNSSGTTSILVLNAQGRVFMEPVVDNPFVALDRFLKKTDDRQKVIFVDFHAEATAEKQAMGFFLDGRVSAMLGTHTHVQTADLRILENGTAYQTDVGMTGSLDSVIGMKREPVIRKFVTGINQKFEVAKENMILDMTLIDVDRTTGKALHTESHRIYEHSYEQQLAL